MARRTVVTLPGDGIGRVVLPEALRVLDAVGFEASYVHADVGWDCWIRERNALPPRTVDLLATHRLGLFGAITSKPKSVAGPDYYSPIVALRQRFALDICIRPCRSLPGNPLNFVRREAGGAIAEPEIDAVVFRQSTEGEYTGVEWTDPPERIRAALAEHERFRPFVATPGPDLAIGTRIVTRHRCRRILAASFRYAADHGYRSVTLCEKPNVLRQTSGMMDDVAREVAGGFPDVEFRSMNIDAMMIRLARAPESAEVVVAGNLFGDILSDAFAGHVGGLGFVPSANIGDDVAIFEPTHGSAPKYAAYDPPIVNPCAMILTAAMLLDHVGENRRAERIRRAVASVIADGRVRTFDILGLPGGPEVVARGAATTEQFTDAVLRALE